MNRLATAILFVSLLGLASICMASIPEECKIAISELAGESVQKLSFSALNSEKLLENVVVWGRNKSILERSKDTEEWWTADHQQMSTDLLFRWEELSRDELVKDLVGDGEAKIVEDRSDSLRLEFPNGDKLYFSLQDGLAMEMWTYSTVKDYKEGTSAYHRLLEHLTKKKLLGKYFRKNPYRKEEEKALKQLRSSEEIRKPDEIKIEQLQDFLGSSKKSVLLVPDRHGDRRRIQVLEYLVERKEVDWVGLEMLPHTMQPVLDQFLKADPSSSEFVEARQKILEYFGETAQGTAWRSHWLNPYAAPVKAEQVPYYQILLKAKESGTRIVALDSADYRSQHIYDNKNLHTRNVVWSQSIPKSGRGVVFGGAHHFYMKRGANFQDFVPKSRKLYMLDYPYQNFGYE